MRRKIIRINEQRCTGCGLCIPNCPEGALQIVDGKARVMSDLFCDGLGACIGHCPERAITIEEREAEPYDETRVMDTVVKGGPDIIRAHLEHLRDHGQKQYLREALAFLKERNIDAPQVGETPAGEGRTKPDRAACPGAAVVDFGKKSESATVLRSTSSVDSQLRQWPIQITLVPPAAPFLKNADLLIAADCVPFAYAEFHDGLLRGKVLLVGCPKFDDVDLYREKIAQIVKANDIKSVTVVRMEVPCCYGLVRIAMEAIRASGKAVPFSEVVIGIRGERR
jgi:ferredoxin